MSGWQVLIHTAVKKGKKSIISTSQFSRVQDYLIFISFFSATLSFFDRARVRNHGNTAPLRMLIQMTLLIMQLIGAPIRIVYKLAASRSLKWVKAGSA